MLQQPDARAAMDLRDQEGDMGLGAVGKGYQLLQHLFIIQEFIAGSIACFNALITGIGIQGIIITQIVLLEDLINQFAPFAAKVLGMGMYGSIPAGIPAMVTQKLFGGQHRRRSS